MSTDTMTNTNPKLKSRISVRLLAQMALLAAVAAMLMYFEVPLPFAPSFYQIDFSEVPVMIGTFTMGPAAGAIIELVKVMLKLVLKGTTTVGVGDLANFLIGCALCVPAGIIYRKKRSRKGAVIGMAAGTAFMTVVGCFLNAYVLLPTYAKAFEMPVDALVEMGTAVNSSITNLTTFVLFAVAPFNLLKGFLTSLIVFLIYKKISPILKMHSHD